MDVITALKKRLNCT